MPWNQWYAIKSYVGSTMWLSPLAALILEQITFRGFYLLDLDPGWLPGFTFGQSGISSAMDYVITFTMTCIIFTFGSLLVAIQFAGGQLTPRIIATTLLRDKTIRRIVALFTYTLLLAVALKTRLETAPHFLVSLVGVMGLFSVVAALFLIDYSARLLRPVSIVWRVGEEGLKVIESVYPNPVQVSTPPNSTHKELSPAERTIPHRGTSAIVIAISLEALTAVAKRADAVIEFVPMVGDFVAAGEPLFHLRGNVERINESDLRAQVAFGPERTIEQDSTFALRVIVDIAIKALSKAINDPTTAVLAIDQLQRLLRSAGMHHLRDEDIRDNEGTLRLIFRTPNWEDFVQLAFSEIRFYGAENFQVARRLRAMIDALIQTLPESRLPALHRELGLLDRTLKQLHPFEEDLKLARTPDLQGLGGASGTLVKSGTRQ